MTVRDFIREYLSNPVVNPKDGLLVPILDECFKSIPDIYWYGIDGPKGPYGLLRVDIFTRTSAPKGTIVPANVDATTVGTIYFWWAESKLRIVPETALVAQDITKPVIDFDHMKELIDTEKTTISDLSEILTARIVAAKLEGK